MEEKQPNYGWVHKFIDRFVGIKRIRQIREHLKEITLEKSDRFQRWNVDINKTQNQALKSANHARNSGWDKYSILLGLASLLLSFFPPVPLFAGILGSIVSIITGIRRVAVEVLLYQNPHKFRHPDNVKFAYAWNSAMDGGTSLLLVPAGLLAKKIPKAYRIALWVIVDVVEDEFN